MHLLPGNRSNRRGSRPRRLVRIWRERQANIALLSAMLMPLFMGAAGLGVEASNWSVLHAELQRASDVAAMSAAVVYSSTANAQTAAYAGADTAELNGIAGGTRSWNAASRQLTDGSITVQQVSGIRNPSDVAFLVTVQKPVPLTIAKLFVSTTSYNILAESVTELTPANSAQPCVLGLSGYKTGNTSGTDISLSGSSSITGSNCSVRSNGTVMLSGSSSITAASVYAGGSITTTGSSAIYATEFPNDGQIPDPYANATKLQNTFAALGPCPSCTTNVTVSGSNTQTIGAGNYANVSVSGSSTLNMGPGTFSSITVSGSSSVNMSPGLYLVNGAVNISGSSTISAPGGVTIVASGTVTISGSSNSKIVSPGTSPVGGAIPGIAIAGTTGSATSVSGSSGMTITGVVYFPNSALTFSGSSGNPSSPCLELIANTVTLSGSSSLGGNCSSYGAASFGSTNTTTAALVQ